MIMSTPVRVSKARILRPSRPIILPFISSLGKLTVETVMSLAVSVARRWIVVIRISCAFFSAVSWASCSILFIIVTASCFASVSKSRIIKSFACCWVKPEILSNSSLYLSSSPLKNSVFSSSAASLLISSFSCFSTVSTRLSRISSFCANLRSKRWRSLLRSLFSRSCCFCSRISCSFASRRNSFFWASASLIASCKIRSARCSEADSWNLA